MVIMFLITGASALGLFISLYLLLNVVFDQEHRLTLGNLSKRTKKIPDIVTTITAPIWKCLVAGFKKMSQPCVECMKKKKPSVAHEPLLDEEEGHSREMKPLGGQ